MSSTAVPPLFTARQDEVLVIVCAAVEDAPLGRRRLTRACPLQAVISIMRRYPSTGSWKIHIHTPEMRIVSLDKPKGGLRMICLSDTLILYWICAQRSSVRSREFRVDCCGSSITPRSHQIPMMSIFQSTGPRSKRGWEHRFASACSLVVPFSEGAIFHTVRRDRRSVRLGKTMAITYIPYKTMHTSVS